MENEIKFPRYAKLAFILLSLTIIVVTIYLGQFILIPLLLSVLFAILLMPMVVFLNKKLRFPHVIAVLVSVAVFVIFISAIVFFVSWQVSDIADDWKKIKYNLSVHFHHVQHWIRQHFHLSYNKQQNYIDQVTGEGLNGDKELISNTLNSFTVVVSNSILMPIYIFLILLYRNLFVAFLQKLVRKKNERTLIDILIQIKTVVQSYVVGIFIETGIVGLLTTGGLMLFGVEYAVLLGVITAILNLIPYIGVLIAALITVLATLANSTDISVILGVIALGIVVQFIDNNIIVPNIVGNKVRLNALVSIVAVIVAGAIAGIAGMFLAIPIIAMLKVIFDRIDALSPWGFLMGDDLPKTYEWYKIKLPDYSQGTTTEPWPEQINTNIVVEKPAEKKKKAP